ncbi:MAG: 4,5-DOPA dioxygenase extradiol [Bacteroidia bacterium]
MKRSEFIKTLGAMGVGLMGLDQLLKAVAHLPQTEAPMPALFVGHGSPMNIIADNPFTQALKAWGPAIPRPKAILVISAHWLTRGSYVTAAAKPATIHDFFGFPDELYQITYPAPGSPTAAKLTAETLARYEGMVDHDRGIDHGAWSVLHHMYPAADIPVLQLSIDRSRPLSELHGIGRTLRSLRAKGILIIGSGNITHNLSKMDPDENAPVVEWAEEFDIKVKNFLERHDDKALIKYTSWGQISELAHPSNDHFLPLLYTVGLRGENEELKFTHEGIVHGTVSMRCLQIG